MITKAIIPVAGWGTRRLPITKAIEKSMLPVGNRPIIDYVVEDCVKAGITDIYFVVSGHDTQLEKYYSKNEELEAHLIRNNLEDKLSLIQPPDITFHYIVQDSEHDAYGTATPVWLCRDVVGPDEQVLVIMGDQFFYRTDGGSNAADLVNRVTTDGLSAALLAVAIPDEKVSQYGIIKKDENDNYIEIVDKPSPENAPSNLNNASFYVFNAALFAYLDRYMNVDHDGEYMITDVINDYVAGGNAVKVLEATGEYLDGGTVHGWVHANRVITGDLA